MEEVLVDAESNSLSSVTAARPSQAQLTAVVEFMIQNPDLACAKLRNGLSRDKAKRLWEELAAIANTIPGCVKSTQGWMRFWIDKKGMVRSKKKMVDDGKHSSILTPLEEKIWKLCLNSEDGEPNTRKKRGVKVEIDDSDDEVIAKKRRSSRRQSEVLQPQEETLAPDVEERQMNIMEELVQVMNRQASALSQLAQASASNAHAMDRLAEATLTQARAAESIASTFANMGASFHDVRTAIINIDYTMKRCYNINQT